MVFKGGTHTDSCGLFFHDFFLNERNVVIGVDDWTRVDQVLPHLPSMGAADSSISSIPMSDM